MPKSLNFPAKQIANVLAACAAIVVMAAFAHAQVFPGGTASYLPSAGAPHAAAAAAPRGPLARLVENPNPENGMPPYALADQQGRIQRFVEPVPGFDLSTHVGEVVVVRHDTGATILATQIDLPPQPLQPLIGERNAGQLAAMQQGNDRVASTRKKSASQVQQTDFVDNDDSTVQLIADTKAEAADEASEVVEELPTEGMPQEMGLQFTGEMMPGTMAPGMSFGECCDGMTCGPGTCQSCEMYPGMYPPMVPAAPAPQQRELARLYGGMEFNFLRTHISESAIGQTDANYDFSPRFILGFDRSGNLGGRGRYWHYNNKSEADNGNELRFELNVLDLECTHYFEGRHTSLVLAAGARAANFKITGANDDASDADLLGLTMAADGLTPLCCCKGGQFGWVYGGRLSILGGDWGGNNQLFPGRNNDDNMLVNELYVGLQFDRVLPNANLHAKFAFEMQNWQSDTLAQSAGIESVTFMGPGLEIGAEF